MNSFINMKGCSSNNINISTEFWLNDQKMLIHIDSSGKPRAWQKVGNGPGVGKWPSKFANAPPPRSTDRACKCPVVALGGGELDAAGIDWCITLINDIAKFESDLLKTNEGITPQSPKILQTLAWWNSWNFAELYLRLLTPYHFQLFSYFTTFNFNKIPTFPRLF